MTKVYFLAGKSAGKLKTTYCGVEVTLNFRNGLGTRTPESAVLVTSEPFIMDAIENDARFGSTIRLGNTYDNDAQMRNDMQAKRTMNVDDRAQRDAAAVAAAQKAHDEAEEKKKEAVRAKRQRAKAAKEIKEKREEQKVVETQAEEEEDSKGLVFANTNEAMHFFMEKGENVTDITLPKLLEQYGATISE